MTDKPPKLDMSYNLTMTTAGVPEAYAEIHDEEVLSPAWYTCTHQMDGVELVKEAERVVVFHDPQKKVTHVSIRVGDWYVCKVYPDEYYEALTPDQEMQLIAERTAEHRYLQE